MEITTNLHAERALMPDGWAKDVRIEIASNGTISNTEVNVPASPEDHRLTGKVLLPAPVNLHSHAFQRAMAGLTEFRAGSDDDFWSWRSLMYRFLETLDPDDIEAIAALVQMEMLESGYASCVEFHYLHHQPGGTPYDDIGETAGRIAAAAETTGIGLTLLPVLYRRGGLDNRPLDRQQARFANDRDSYSRLLASAEKAVMHLPGGGKIGTAAHSLRAVSPEDIQWIAGLRPDDPIHIHIAEQMAEVKEVQEALGATPVRWLLDHAAINQRWCLIHATHMTKEETRALANTSAVAGLCPITESNLGDGIFDGVHYLEAGGVFGIGSDSNIRISLSEELRTLEYSQRLRDKARARLTAAFPTSALKSETDSSVGRTLFDGTLAGGARAAGRDCGSIAPGSLADLLTLNARDTHLLGLTGDRLLDSWIFAGDDRLISDVFSAGRHLVENGRHNSHQEIAKRSQKTIQKLRQ